MGRHADSEDRSFRRSLLRAVAGGVAAMLVTFGVTAALTLLGRDDGTAGPVVAEAPETAPPATAPVTASPTPSATPAAEPTDPPVAETEAADPVTPGATEAPADVTVQVLDAGGSPERAEQAADVLRDLGYDVVAVNPARRTVATTTVLATPGAEADAAALGERDSRFARTRRNRDFNSEVDLHILVGPDFQA